MVSKDKLDRINELSRKSKAERLSDSELKEQKKLREEYLKAFRKNFRQQLEMIEIVDDVEKH